MKKILRSIAALLAIALIASCCAMSVFAEAAADEAMTDAELEALLSQLESEGVVVSGSTLSGSDVSGSDVIAPIVKPIGSYTLSQQKFDEFGVEFLAPDFDTFGTVYSDADQLSGIFGSDVAANALFDISYSGFTNYIYYGTTDDGSSMMAMTYTESNWSRFLGSYADLSPEAQARIEAGSDLIGVGDGSTASFRIVNGTPMLCQEYYDVTYLTKYYVVQAVVNGGLYELYIQLSAPTEADTDAVDQIINSLKVKGYDVTRYGVASSAAVGWLIALVAVLFIAVALLAFFVIRFSLFARASGSSFNIIGFDLPSAAESDELYDEADEDSDDLDD